MSITHANSVMLAGLEVRLSNHDASSDVAGGTKEKVVPLKKGVDRCMCGGTAGGYIRWPSAELSARRRNGACLHRSLLISG